MEGGTAASPTVSVQSAPGAGGWGGDTSGLGDKPEGPTVLPGPPGDTELLGSLLATAEMACHPVGGALPRERAGRLSVGARCRGPPCLESGPKCLSLFSPRVTLNYFFIIKDICVF